MFCTYEEKAKVRHDSQIYDAVVRPEKEKTVCSGVDSIGQTQGAPVDTVY